MTLTACKLARKLTPAQRELFDDVAAQLCQRIWQELPDVQDKNELAVRTALYAALGQDTGDDD